MLTIQILKFFKTILSKQEISVSFWFNVSNVDLTLKGTCDSKLWSESKILVISQLNAKVLRQAFLRLNNMF